jgi:autophagy-related protein 18
MLFQQYLSLFIWILQNFIPKDEISAGIVEMLYNTSLVAIVGSGSSGSSSPRHLQIVNTKRSTTICELNFVSGIIAVRLNRKRVVVVLEGAIHIYDIANMKMLYSIDTLTNYLGISSFSLAFDSSNNRRV